VSQGTDVSVVVSTYNSPRYLELVLAGFAAQRLPGGEHFEVVIADDGSGPETAAAIERARADTGLAIQHVWQADDGFRKTEILNKALDAARGEYLVFTDGDCIPRSDFLAVHVERRGPGRFLSGGYVKLPADTTAAVTVDAVREGLVFDARWLARHGFRLGKQRLKLDFPRPLRDALNKLSPTPTTWNGHNASGWKADVLRVNGFDERMKYGGEDCELGDRLNNAGVRGLRIRYSAICVHLDHGRPYKNPEDLKRNKGIRRSTQRERRDYTPFGLRKDAGVAGAR
jgi:glycosyltransferase involved in cell wall biosynthesis